MLLQLLAGITAGLAIAEAETWEESFEKARRLAREGRYAEALPVLSGALKYAEVFGSKDERLAVTLDNLGFLHFQLGDYVAAENALVRSVRAWESQGPSGQEGLETPLNNLGMLYRYERRASKAVEILRRVYESRIARLGSDHADVAYSLGVLAEASGDPKDLASAEAQMSRVLAREPTAELASNLGNIRRIRGRNAEAAEAFSLAVGIWEASLGAEHPVLAEGLANLGGLYVDTGQYAQAEPLLARALRITTGTLGPGHPLFARILAYRAELCRKTGRVREAKQLLRNAWEIQEAHQNRNLLNHTIDIRSLSRH